MKKPKELLKSLPIFPLLQPIIIWYRKRKLKRLYYWMTKQMHLVDPAQDDRPKYWLKCGVKSSGKFRVGYGVYFDATNANMITIEDGVWIAANCLFLCHRRQLKDYHIGDDYNQLPYKIEPIVLKKAVALE